MGAGADGEQLSPTLGSVAFLILSFALGLSFKGTLGLIGTWRKEADDQPDLAEPDALDQMLTWTGFAMLGVGFLDYFPGLHPGLASPPWAAYATGIGCLLLACSQVAHKAAVQMESEEVINWTALALVALGSLFHFREVIFTLWK